MASWHILTGEYPPQPGGVSDYSRLVAQGLAAAGDIVQVWCPPCSDVTQVDSGVDVRRLPDHFGLRSLACLNRDLKRSSAPQRILIQYVPQAFGWKGLNIPFCLWLWSRRRESVWVMFHEVYFPLARRQKFAHTILAVGTRLMARLVARAARQIFVSTTGWNKLLKPLVSKHQPINWLPVPSTIQRSADVEAVSATRSKYSPSGGQIIGHFGSFGSNIAALLTSFLPAILTGRDDRTLLLLGRGSEKVRDQLTQTHLNLNGRVFATSAMPAAEISQHLLACDLLVQPFVDGVSTRRTSVMAGLAHGLPVVTTSGPATETVWTNSGAIALVPTAEVSMIVEEVEGLLSDKAARKRMGDAARKLYEDRFDLRHTIATLRNLSG